MPYAVCTPAESGLKGYDVSVRGMTGYVQRTMRLLGKPGSPAVTANIRVIEYAPETTSRLAVNSAGPEEEGVFARCADLLQLEMPRRHSWDPVQKTPTANGMRPCGR